MVVMVGRWSWHPVCPTYWENINRFAANRLITSTSEQLLGQWLAKANTALCPEDREHRQLRLLSGFQDPLLPPQWSP